MITRALLGVFCVWPLSLPVYAADVPAFKADAPLLSAYDVFQWLLALLFVLALFAGLVWLLRKSGNLPLAGKNQLSVITGVSIGVREKLVLVKVGKKQLLLGVTPGRVDKLLELEGEERLFQDQECCENNVPFADKLQQVMQRRTNG